MFHSCSPYTSRSARFQFCLRRREGVVVGVCEEEWRKADLQIELQVKSHRASTKTPYLSQESAQVVLDRSDKCLGA